MITNGELRLKMKLLHRWKRRRASEELRQQLVKGAGMHYLKQVRSSS